MRMAKYTGPFSRDTEYIDTIADVLVGDEDPNRSHGGRKTVALQRLAEFITGDGFDKFKNIQSDWEESNPESDAFIRNIPDDLVRDGNYVHTDNNFTDAFKDKLESYVMVDDNFTTEDREKLESIEWGATNTDIDAEITQESTNPVESAAIHAALETKVDKVDGYVLSKNDFTDELKAKLDAIDSGASHLDVDQEITSDSENPVKSAAIHAALETKVDKEEGRGLSDENFTHAEKLKLEAIEAQATRTIPDANITAGSHNVVESRAIYEALDTKVNKVTGKGLSTNDFTTAEQNKLAGIEANANNTVIEPQISDSSTNPVESRAIFDALSLKVDKLTGKDLSDENFTLEEKTKLGRLNPDAPKITIARLVFDQNSGEPAKLNLTWQECKDAISNGILYYQESNGGLESICLCYRVETETSGGETIYKAEFASFAAGIFEYFAASSADGYPACVSEVNFQPDMTVKVDKTTTVNGHALSSNVTITPNDISYEATQQFDVGTLGNALNILRSVKADAATKVNGHALESDVTVGAGDIGYQTETAYTEGSIGEKIGQLDSGKVDKVTGYGLSKNDFTDALKAKLDAVEAEAQANVIESVKVNGAAQTVVNKSVDVAVPTKTSDITNDSDFVTHADLSDANPVMDGVASPGTSQNFARADHVHQTDTSRAPIASPAFTGTPTAPTAVPGTVTTQIATTEFVSSAISAASASAFEIKGSKATYSELPVTGNKSGDVWYIDDEQSTYFWDGEDWKLMGNAIDTTQFVTFGDVTIVTEAQIDNLFNS